MTKLMPKFEQHRTDFAYCQAITKRSSSAFYTAFSQLPLERA
ncbi:phytoene synthase [Lactiplantibacillus plantarum]|nr:phytoene synthase [Lactiplantibacillus plantarum]